MTRRGENDVSPHSCRRRPRSGPVIRRRPLPARRAARCRHGDRRSRLRRRSTNMRPWKLAATVADGLGDWVVWLKDKDGDLWLCNASSAGAVYANTMMEGDLLAGDGAALIDVQPASNSSSDRAAAPTRRMPQRRSARQSAATSRTCRSWRPSKTGSATISSGCRTPTRLLAVQRLGRRQALRLRAGRHAAQRFQGGRDPLRLTLELPAGRNGSARPPKGRPARAGRLLRICARFASPRETFASPWKRLQKGL